jgi:hypothetical protein
VYSTTVPANYCYVIYDFDGGDGVTDVQCYDSNDPVASKVTPTREGYTFAAGILPRPAAVRSPSWIPACVT